MLETAKKILSEMKTSIVGDDKNNIVGNEKKDYKEKISGMNVTDIYVSLFRF